MPVPSEAAEGIRMGSARGRWVLLATVLGSSLVMLDGTVVNVALGRIGSDLDADFAGLQWIVNAYTLSLAALILLGGALGDRFGRRRVFLIGVVWFALASLLCALAPTAELLALSRALQGVGGALLTPGSLAMIAATFSAQDRSRAVGAWSAFGGIAGAIGPFVGGWLVEWDWRLVFLLNLPLAVVVVVVARVHVPETRDPSTVRGFDVSGTVLGAAGLGVLTYGLIAGGRGFGPFVWALIAAGVVLLGAFLLVERRSPHPLVPLDLFSNRTFTAVNGVTFLVYAALGVFFFLLVLQLQVVAGFSPIAAGTALLPVTAIMLTFSSRSGALADRIGARLPLTVGPLVAAGGLLLASRIGSGSSYLGTVLPAVVLFGAGLSLTVAPLTATVLGSAESRHAGIASGVNNAVARAAGLLSVAVIPVVAGLSGQAYADPAAMSDGFRMAMMICAGLLAVGGVLSFTTVRTPARASSGAARSRPTPATTAPTATEVGAAGAAGAVAAGPGAVPTNAAAGAVPTGAAVVETGPANATSPGAGPTSTAAAGAEPTNAAVAGTGPASAAGLGGGPTSTSAAGAGPASATGLGAGPTSAAATGAGPTSAAVAGARPTNAGDAGAGPASVAGAVPTTAAAAGAGPTSGADSGTGPTSAAGAGAGPAGAAAAGAGPANAGPTGAGPTGAGPTGAGPTGAGPTGAGPAGAAVAGGATAGRVVSGVGAATPGVVAPGVVPGAAAGTVAAGAAPSVAAPEGSPDEAAPDEAGSPEPARGGFDLAKCLHCGVTGPQLYPSVPMDAPPVR